jgi:hypothetical protein
VGGGTKRGVGAKGNVVRNKMWAISSQKGLGTAQWSPRNGANELMMAKINEVA